MLLESLRGMPRVSKVSLCKLLLIHVVIVVVILLNVLQID